MSQAEAQWVEFGIDILKKRLLYALFLTFQNLANSKFLSKAKQR